MNTWQACYRLLRNQARGYWINAVVWGIFHALPLLPALFTRTILDKLTGDAPVSWNISTLLALLVGIGIARFAMLVGNFLIYIRFRNQLTGTLRINMLREILRQPGAAALPNSPGEAVSRFTGDVREVTRFAVDRLVDLWGFLALPVIGLGVMFSINAHITWVIIILAIVIVVINPCGGAWSVTETNDGGQPAVIGFIAEMFGAVQRSKSPMPKRISTSGWLISMRNDARPRCVTHSWRTHQHFVCQHR
ncbi:MAG: ABC transporter transmembrane domain-containing protein [Caldilineaceae bacterium]